MREPSITQVILPTKRQVRVDPKTEAALIEGLEAAVGASAARAIATVAKQTAEGSLTRQIGLRLLDRLLPARDRMPMPGMPRTIETAADYRAALRHLYAQRVAGAISDDEWAKRRNSVTETFRAIREAQGLQAVGL